MDTIPQTTAIGLCIRTQVVSALLKGSLQDGTLALKSGAASNGGHPGTAAAVEASLIYLRDRVRERFESQTSRGVVIYVCSFGTDLP